MSENYPYLISWKPLKSEYEHLSKINITCEEFTIGRGLKNLAVIPFLSISRNHCVVKKRGEDEWVLEDLSSFGIQVNGDRIGKGNTRKLTHDDIIALEPSNEFIYKFIDPASDMFEIPNKRRKLNRSIHEDLLNDVKIKFEESQTYELKHLEEKILSTKQRQETSMMLKTQLQQDMDRKMQQLENDFAEQIENLKGEKLEVEIQKAKLIEERDAQLATVKDEMEGKIKELMEQIQKHNETETELLNENNQLKEKLQKEREEFLAELNRENSSKQDMLEKLEAKMREQEETRQREKQELEEQLKKEMEQIRMAKEQELKELEEQKKQLEQKLVKELNDIKQNLAQQKEQTEQERLKAQETLNERVEQLKKVSEEEKLKMEQLLHEKESMLQKLSEAEINAEKEMTQLKEKIREREIELAALAAERIQKQAEQSGEVISSLQEQLEKTKSLLQTVEIEKNTLLESLCLDNPGEGTSKQAMAEVGELMDSELQCSICAELFIMSTTLNCSHTFCKYCINMWKKKKKDCPICRAPITSECRSLVLDSFIEKVVQKSEEMKKKREELLKAREELEAELVSQNAAEYGYGRRSSFMSSASAGSDSEFLEEEEEHEGFDFDDDYHYGIDSLYAFGRRYYDSADDSNSGLDDDSESDGSESEASGADAAAAAGPATATTGDAAAGGANAAGGNPTAAAGPVSGLSNNTTERSSNNGGRRRRRGVVPGLPGATYGGYGRCYRCGARGHWAPGCPLRQPANQPNPLRRE